MTNKHAYLIICHKNINQIKLLIQLLDYKENDIYIHIDKKSKDINTNDFDCSTKQSKLYVTKKINVNWGGYSQINVELLLLSLAVKQEYSYYHLISGEDLPLYPPEYIHNYFSNRNGREYISVEARVDDDSEYIDRIRYYHLFQDTIGRNSGKRYYAMYILESWLLSFQKKLNVNRIKHSSVDYYKGGNWFSITHDLATYVLTNYNKIKNNMKWTICADEIFLQTLAMESPFSKNISNQTCRCIDWNRGTPYTFTIEDAEMIYSADAVFARKFNPLVDKQIIKLIVNTVTKEKKDTYDNDLYLEASE